MQKKQIIFLFIFALSPFHVESQSGTAPRSQLLTSSSCSHAHGWMSISTPGIVGHLSCFAPEIRNGYASIGGGGVNGRDDVSIQMNFLSRAGTHTCKVPTVMITFRENRNSWDAYRIGNAKFGDCSITQTFENDHQRWKGHASASLVIVKGDTATGSPRKLHTEKDSSGNPVTRTVEVDWEFDQTDSREPASSFNYNVGRISVSSTRVRLQ
jgi:hypothetical protein